MTPLHLRFDGELNVQGSNIVRLPKLCQGAPYSFGLKVRLEDTTYRDFGTVDGMQWRIKLAPRDVQELMFLTKEAGNFTWESETNTLTFLIHAADWVGVNLPTSPNHMEMDVPFAFVMEFLDEDGVVVERFAQGSGLISVNLFT